MIPCPLCGSGQLRLYEGVYPEALGVDWIECQDCGKGFDVMITWEGVELAPVFHRSG